MASHIKYALKYELGTVKFTNHNKQIPILFKIYADRECFLNVSILTKVNMQ